MSLHDDYLAYMWKSHCITILYQLRQCVYLAQYEVFHAKSGKGGINCKNTMITLRTCGQAMV